MSFVFVCQQISVRNTNQLSWESISTIHTKTHSAAHRASPALSTMRGFMTVDDILRVSGHQVDDTDGQMSDQMDSLNINIQNENHRPVEQMDIDNSQKQSKAETKDQWCCG